MKNNCIITSADSHIGEFLTQHWLVSLKQTNNLNDCDVVVINYGMSEKHLHILKEEKIIVIQGSKKYHIVNKRFFDAALFLRKHSYKQVLFIDSGDVIFQGDFTHLFRNNENTFRVAPLGKRILFYKWFIYRHFKEEIKREIWRVIQNKPVINAGVIFAPVDRFIALVQDMQQLIRDKEEFGPDQIIVNYHLHKDKNYYTFLDAKYNFMMSTSYAGFRLKNGEFYKLNGEKIVIVHNAGQMDIFRPIYNFGFGPSHNQIKPVMYLLKRTMYYLLELYKKLSLRRKRRKTSII